MADLKISQLNALPGASLAAADELAVVDTSASETKKIVPADLVQYGYTLLSAGTLDGDIIEAGTTSARGTIQLTDSTASTSTTTAATPNAVKSAYDLADAALPKAGGTVSGNLIVSGDFTVNGTTTTIDTTTLVVEDKNIEIGVVGTPTDVTADGGGIILKGTTDKTINWVDATDAWTFSEHVNIASTKEYRIAGTKVLDATSLGSAVVSSSLTSVGTLTSGTWSATTIATNKGGTGQTSYTDGELLIGKTDGTLAKATLTASTGVTITNGDGTITISATGSGGTVTSVTATSPIASTGGTTPVISIQDASTTQKGAVQLDNTFTSTSTTTAATANTVRVLAEEIVATDDIATAALPKTGGTMTGDITFAGTQTFPGTLVSGDIGVTVQGYDADTAKYDDTTANFTGTLQNGGSNVLVDTDIGSTVQAYDADTAKYDDTTANFTGTLQNGGSNVLVDTDIGSTVQAYDVDTAKYDDTTANFTGTLQNGGSNVVVDSDIGVTVQAYDADTAKYDAATANFTGTLQNGGSNVVVDSDIGSTVQAYDADTAKLDVAQTFTAPQRGGVVALTDGATITPDFSSGNNYSVTLAGNRTLANPTNAVAGQSGVIVITQDGTGSRTLAYGSNWKFAGGTDPTLTTAANAVDVLTYYCASSTVIIASLLGDVK